MEIFKSVVLGIIQGLTEFFPVSSSGHLVIFPYFFKWQEPSIYFTVTLHFATLAALLTVLYRDAWLIIKNFFLGLFIKKYREDSGFKLALHIIIASIPAAVIGYLFNDFIETFFSKPIFSAAFLILTAAILILFEFIGKKNESKYSSITGQDKKINYLTALIIGISQAVAIFPGISRSGSTISSARIFGVKREDAVRFSFLISIPVIFGSFVFEMAKGFKNSGIKISHDNIALIAVIAGFIFAYLSGLFAVKFLLKFSIKRNLNIFAVYCVILSIIFFVVYFIRK
ncbi:MAG: undecaprenyl-diphosphate phosphatase [Actinobacteria bacterium]|nr:undecaprenyl-diphosphate phosphatase [Actinomycetota bacterium]